MMKSLSCCTSTRRVVRRLSWTSRTLLKSPPQLNGVVAHGQSNSVRNLFACLNGNFVRSRNVGVPNSIPPVINTSGDSRARLSYAGISRQVNGSPGSGWLANSNSLSRPHWNRNSLIIFAPKVEDNRRLTVSTLTKSSQSFCVQECWSAGFECPPVRPSEDGCNWP